MGKFRYFFLSCLYDILHLDLRIDMNLFLAELGLNSEPYIARQALYHFSHTISPGMAL
jgi:hypothetical protein